MAVESYPKKLWDRLAVALARRPEEVAADRRRAPGLLAELLSAVPAARATLAVTAERFQSVALAELLIARALEEGAHGLGSAELALAVAGALAESGCTAGLAEQLRARSWAAVANARRVQGRMEEARSAFERAAFHLASSPDPLEESLFYRLRSLLHRDLGDLGAAIAVQDRAVELLAGFGRPAPGAVALIELAALHSAAGDEACTRECLRGAAAMLGSELAAELTRSTRAPVAPCQ